MVDCEYSIDIYKSVKTSIGTIMRNLEMLNFFLIIWKLKKCVSIQLKNYLCLYVPYQYKTQQMCHNTTLEKDGALKSACDCYKNQQLCDKTVENPCFWISSSML